MKFLLDTNVLISLEPTSLSDADRDMQPAAAELVRLIHQAKHQYWIHPATLEDLRNDRDVRRRKLRELFLGKYPILNRPPDLGTDLRSTVGSPQPGTNDWNDAWLLAALRANAVDVLVSDDDRLHRKARRADLEDRVYTTREALDWVRRLFDQPQPPPPAVESVWAYNLRPDDPIFDSFRQDYRGFDAWLRKCRLEGRQSWVIQNPDSSGYSAVCIVNQETERLDECPGKVLKICSFKVAQESSGLSYGELLLRTVFQHAHLNSYDWLYITVRPRYDFLMDFLASFGFSPFRTATTDGDLEYAKPLRPGDQSLAPLDYHIRYGPYCWKSDGVPLWIVPIQPNYHKTLFPDADDQMQLIAGGRASGNSIRKAYLSRSGIRSLSPGDVLLFYRSDDRRAITAVAVAEETLVSNSPEELARFVGKRTVYRFQDIQAWCDGGSAPVLAILFRYAYPLATPIPFARLKEHGALVAAPQSTLQVKREALQWLQTQLSAP